MRGCPRCGRRVKEDATSCAGCGLHLASVGPTQRGAGESLAGELSSGDALGGYVIDAEIARGGMGVVYLARDETLGRRIALKVITPGLAADATFRKRFRSESRLSANVEHPNVVPVYRAGQDRGLL